MNIGMTFDLKDAYLSRGFSLEESAEFDSAITIETIESVLKGLGHSVDRIGAVDRLVSRLADGDRWDMVFNIAEGMFGPGREAQVPALLDAWNIPYTFSGPDLLALSLNKGWTNAVVRSLGVPTADFVVVHSSADIYNVDLPFPLFAKPVAEGTSKGICARSVVHNGPELKDICEDLLERFQQPVLVETYLPGREFTVGILGDHERAHSVGVMEVKACGLGDTGAYTYENKQVWQDRVKYSLADDADARAAGTLAVVAWKGLGYLDAGRVDVRMDARGLPCFIEVNPLPGLNPQSSDLPILYKLGGGSFEQLITSIQGYAETRAIKRAGSRGKRVA
ncbi:MAG: D-alanine--D-alanine ligase [Desulfoplanes sp.]